MKKIYIFLCIASILFVFTGIQKSQATRKQLPTRSYVKTGKPDLAVTVKFAVTPYKNSKGIQCYSTRPIFTITNKGQSTARNFDYIIEGWVKRSNSNSYFWQIYARGQNETLADGKTKTMDYSNNPTWDLPWCVNQSNWRPTWRIKVDTKNVVDESNEDNNVAKKTFLSMPRTRTLQRR